MKNPDKMSERELRAEVIARRINDQLAERTRHELAKLLERIHSDVDDLHDADK